MLNEMKLNIKHLCVNNPQLYESVICINFRHLIYVCNVPEIYKGLFSGIGGNESCSVVH